MYVRMNCFQLYVTSFNSIAELTEEEVKVVPVTQSTYMQRNKLKYLLEKIDKLLGLTENQRVNKWSMQSELV